MSTAVARAMFEKAELAANDFLAAFEASRQGKRGNSTDTEQDLLRAMLVFAAAGLDATIKQLIRDALKPTLAISGSAAQTALEAHAARKLRDLERKDYKLLAQLIAAQSARDRLIEDWIRSLTDDSMQSVEQVQSAANAFGLAPDAVFDRENHDLARSAFEARNHIVHEMDLEPQQAYTTARQRHQRGRDEMKAHTDVVLQTARKFLQAVEAALPGV